MAVPAADEILLPLLKLMRSTERTLHEAIREVASMLPLSPAEKSELKYDFMHSPVNSQVSCACILLGQAGLTEKGLKQSSWRISERGHKVLEQNPARLTVEDLKQFPEFLEARARAKRRSQAHNFRELRFEYYATGRKLLLEGAFSAAPVLLGYAIEMALKAGLHKIEESWQKKPDDKRLVNSSHDLARLYQRAQALGVFPKTFIASDFLQYASDHFLRRYPSGERDLLDARGGWSIGAYKLATYDDCLCQLDAALAMQSGDDEESMIFFALYDPRAFSLAEAVFSDNPFALDHARRYLEEEADTTRAATPSFAAELHKCPELDKRFRKAADPELRALHLAALYRYPGPGEPDPDPLLCGTDLHSERAWPLSHIDWLLSRLRQAFGSRNVRVEALRRPKDHLTVYVFDRTAKNWWRALPLGNKLYLAATAIRTDQTEANLTAWIEETKKQFKEKRRNLRMPPTPL